MTARPSFFPVVVLVSGLLGGMPGQPAAADSIPPVAVLLSVEGPVTWRAEGSQASMMAKAGDELGVGTFVKTGVRARALLRWRNGGELRMQALSELTIRDPDGVDVSGGKVWARFREKLLSPFFFRAPSATAVVRGTILGVGVEPGGASRVAVLEGRVEVGGSRGGPTVMLEPGQSISADPAGTLGPIAPVTPGDRQEGAIEPIYAPPAAPPEPPGGAWLRFDDLTRRSLDWLDRNRASERLPLLRQAPRPNGEKAAESGEGASGDRAVGQGDRERSTSTPPPVDEHGTGEREGSPSTPPPVTDHGDGRDDVPSTLPSDDHGQDDSSSSNDQPDDD